jgi:serine/threonine-protein kinase RsbT
VESTTNSDQDAVLDIRQESDVILLTRLLRKQADAIRMSALTQTKLTTAASELARNILMHAGTGTVQMKLVYRNGRKGIQLIVRDTGPGIADIPLAMQRGYTTGSGMGLGLPGAKRLSDYFRLTSQIGKGTEVTIIKWADD